MNAKKLVKRIVSLCNYLQLVNVYYVLRSSKMSKLSIIVAAVGLMFATSASAAVHTYEFGGAVINGCLLYTSTRRPAGSEIGTRIPTVRLS